VNGAGKSTLLKLVAGEIAPDAGAVTLGAGVRLGYFAQHAMELLDADKTVYETLEEAFPLASVGTIKSLGGCFGFSGSDIDKICRVLSGGEKARLVMARLLFDRPNLLVLDEPTNHLDMATKEMLLVALRDFEGTMLFVSHDRRFLAGLSNRVLELVPEGVIPTAAATWNTWPAAATKRPVARVTLLPLAAHNLSTAAGSMRRRKRTTRAPVGRSPSAQQRSSSRHRIRLSSLAARSRDSLRRRYSGVQKPRTSTRNCRLGSNRWRNRKSGKMMVPPAHTGSGSRTRSHRAQPS